MGVKERKIREFKQREEEILFAAYELLIDLEPIQMTMEMIAEKTEIGRGTIYKHFKSKDEIYAYLILKKRKSFLEKLDFLKTQNKDLLKKLIQAYIDYSTSDINAFIVHKKCLNHYLKSNINETLIENMKLQENKKIKLIEGIMGKALAPQPPKGGVSQELSYNNFSFRGLEGPDLEPENIRYLIYAGWGMLRGAMDFMLENRDLIIEDKKLFQEAIEQIFLRGLT